MSQLKEEEEPDGEARPPGPGSVSDSKATGKHGTYAVLQDWERHRTTITDLYSTQRRPLKEVMEIMEKQHTILMNVMALSLVQTAFTTIKLDSFATGVALLSGLFVYDIWWVFGSKQVFGADVVSQTTRVGPLSRVNILR